MVRGDINQSVLGSAGAIPQDDDTPLTVSKCRNILGKLPFVVRLVKLVRRLFEINPLRFFCVGDEIELRSLER